ncbi:stalk domain-containing protein [Brevibacillus sp. DP1.3A]|uniref:stalk domain-containing protein n=1 Tax=Brevibacillus sp. DP1.3A TaxID=2738867 RepID=UPI00156BD8B0|nr:stalk domain-containing protein [Brevibacillus sp. DP1.3A]UED76022.1 copper amine oxidase N-terminal domain-containing protein [Brevibacillus sp. DP1.3A]
MDDSKNPPLAYATVSWGNTSPSEIEYLVATLDLYSKSGKKISLAPATIKKDLVLAGDSELGLVADLQFKLVKDITDASHLDGAYIRDQLSYSLGRQTIPQANIETKLLSASYRDNKLHVEAAVFNIGDATATNFKWDSVIVGWGEKPPYYDVIYTNDSSKKHPVLNESLTLEPGRFVKASFDLPLEGPAVPLPEIKDISFRLETEYGHSTPHRINRQEIFVNNQRLDSDIVDDYDTMYVPLRDLAEALGATVTWEERTQSALVKKGNTSILTSVGNPNYSLNGDQDRVLNNEPRLFQNTTLIVPLRFFSGLLDSEVIYDRTWTKEPIELIIVIPRSN